MSIAQQYIFRNIGEGKNFEVGATYYLLQDKKGFVWMGTNGDLNRYNGRKLVSHNIFQAVYGMWEDEKGRIFYLPSDSRPGYVRNDSVYSMPAADTLSKLLEGGRFFISDMCSLNSTQYLVSTQRGFYTFNKNSLDEVKLVNGPDSVSFWIKIIAGKAYGAYYPIPSQTTNTSHIYKLRVKFNGKDLTIPVELEKGSAGPSVFKCLLLKDGRLLAGFYNKILVINLDGSWYWIPLKARLTFLYQDADDGIWVCYYKNGAGHFRNADLGQVPFRVLPELSISSVMQDAEGGIWISTLDENVFYCTSTAIISYSNVPEISKNILGLNRFENKVICGNSESRSVVFTTRTDFTVLDLSDKVKSLATFAYVKHNNKIYACGRSNSYLMDTSFRFIKILSSPEKSSVSLYNMVKTKDQLLGVSFSNLWRVRNDSLIQDKVLPARGKDISSDSSGRVYVGTNAGLFILKDDNLVPVKTVTAPVIRMRSFGENNIWVTTESNGIYQMDGERVLKHYSDKEGLPGGACSDVALGSDGDAWVATNNGLYRIDKNNTLANYRAQEGLPHNILVRIVYHKGDLYVLGAKGLCSVHASDLKINKTTPRIYIDSVLVNGKITQANTFHYKDCNLSFYANALSYFNSEGVKYMYRLKGLDSAWKANSTGEIAFTSLNNGDYEFEMYALSVNNVKSEKISYSFTIRPPLWKTWWFITFEIILGIFVIYLIIQWRINVIKKREEEKTALNKMIAEYQMNAIRAQMNPHFIFNAINSIQHYILSNETQYAYDYLAKFSKLIREVLVNSEKKETTLKDEIEMLNLYLDLEKRRFKDRFDYAITCSEELEDIKVPVMLIQPFIENAIWHGFMPLDEGVKGRLKLDFTYDKHILKVSIEDNGIGREESERVKKETGHISFGMKFTQKRVDLFKYINKSDSRLEVVDLKDEYGKALGTRVEIYLTIND